MTTKNLEPQSSAKVGHSSNPQRKATNMPRTSTVVLPKACDDAESWDRLIEKVKAFRLEALRDSPEAFSSTFTEWQTFDKEFWEARLRNARATQTVSLALPASYPTEAKCELQDILECQWLASAVLIRPEDQDLSKFSASQSPWSSITTESHSTTDQASHSKDRILFVVNGVHVSPAYRGLGVGTSHMAGTIDAGNAIGRAERASEVQYQVRVVSTNISAVKLYQRLGFTEVNEERVMMKEKVKDGVMIPAQEVRILVMDRVEVLS
jgi:ribosomal protein S18 acetylase RimI-like enzyme